MTSENKRRDERVPAVLEVVWEGAAGKYQARTGDLSVGGCYIDTIGQTMVGEVISFQLHLPTGQWLALQGEVVYQMYPTGYGVRFINLSQTARVTIAQVVADFHRR